MLLGNNYNNVKNLFVILLSSFYYALALSLSLFLLLSSLKIIMGEYYHVLDCISEEEQHHNHGHCYSCIIVIVPVKVV